MKNFYVDAIKSIVKMVNVKVDFSIPKVLVSSDLFFHRVSEVVVKEVDLCL